MKGQKYGFEALLRQVDRVHGDTRVDETRIHPCRAAPVEAGYPEYSNLKGQRRRTGDALGGQGRVLALYESVRSGGAHQFSP